jgi:hypothetical protein
VQNPENGKKKEGREHNTQWNSSDAYYGMRLRVTAAQVAFDE